MATRPNAEDYIDLKIINDAEYQKLFTELLPSIQNKIVLGGMREAAKLILQQAKSNFKNSQKNKSSNNYKDFNRSFTTEPLRSTFGLKVGIKNYKYRWIQWGTDDRYYKKGRKKFFRNRKDTAQSDASKHETGRIQPTNFFFNAVNTKKTEAQNKVSEAIIRSLEKTVSKYATNQ